MGGNVLKILQFKTSGQISSGGMSFIYHAPARMQCSAYCSAWTWPRHYDLISMYIRLPLLLELGMRGVSASTATHLGRTHH